MAKVPGQALSTYTQTLTITGDGSASDGDAVAMASGKITQADGTNDPNVIGVLADGMGDKSDGEKVAVHVDGQCVANVASGTAAGVELGSGATEGQFATGSQGINTLTAEGDAGDLGGSIEAGYAAVDL